MRWLRTLAAAAALSFAGSALAAEIHVMISAGFYKVYSQLAPAPAIAKAGLAPIRD